MGKTKKALREGGRIAASIAIGIILLTIITSLDDRNDAKASQPDIPAPQSDIMEPPNPDVLAAELEVFFVQSGTEHPYTGNGIPGIIIKTKTGGSVIDWTINGWANQTTPSSIQFCSHSVLYYSKYDWRYQGSNGGNFFTTVPTTVLERMGPNGDQCSIRIGATGIWPIRVCIEGKLGGPKGLTRGTDGVIHNDPWDRCIEQVVRVGA